MDIFYDLGEIRTYTNALDIPKNFEAFKNIHFPVDEEYNGNFFVVMKNKNRLKNLIFIFVCIYNFFNNISYTFHCKWFW